MSVSPFTLFLSDSYLVHTRRHASSSVRVTPSEKITRQKEGNWPLREEGSRRSHHRPFPFKWVEYKTEDPFVLSLRGFGLRCLTPLYPELKWRIFTSFIGEKHPSLFCHFSKLCRKNLTIPHILSLPTHEFHSTKTLFFTNSQYKPSCIKCNESYSLLCGHNLLEILLYKTINE